MQWINFLHFYQPANTDYYIIKEALDKSYWRLVRLMEEHPNLRMTWNVSGCLLERLYDAQEFNFLERLAALIKNGQIELTGTAAYHGLLPLLPREEVVRQIEANLKIVKKTLGIKIKPAGFFLPEMAYSPKVAEVIKSLGYEWIIIDEVATEVKPCSFLVKDKISGLKVVLRNRKLSQTYPPTQILKSKSASGQDFMITATDAELYGLRHQDQTAEMEKVGKLKDLKTLTISEAIKELEKGESFVIDSLKLSPCSWDSTRTDIENGEPFKLWKDKNNVIHRDLWRLANLALSLDELFAKDINYEWYRWHLVRGVASCTFWWASEYDFSNVFGPYAWNPDIIERGLEDMIRAVRSLNDKKSKKYKLEAENYYLKIKKNIWQRHWNKHWQN